MRVTIGLLSFAVLFVVVVNSYPSYNVQEIIPMLHHEDISDATGLELEQLMHSDIVDNRDVEAMVHERRKRATCDALSGFGVGHSACAAHCLLKGFKGGWCDGRQVCNCRR